MSSLWLRWTWRDFRSRWVSILTTALILAIGIGAFFGVGGLREWRKASADESFAAMRAHDLRVDLAEGAFVDEGSLVDAVGRISGGSNGVVAAEERLVAASQVDASVPGRPILVPARVIGIPLRAGGQEVDQLATIEGRGLDVTHAHHPAAVIDWSFARRYDLPVSGSVELAGAGRIPYLGQGVTPEHVLIVDETGLPGGESGLATLYMGLDAAQAATGHEGSVNQLVIRLADAGDVGELSQRLSEALAAALPNVGATVTRGDEEPSRRYLYRDADNDHKVMLTIAILILLAAAFAAFNLISRVVEAQRREIGIGMALGVEPRGLAIRPLALGAQIGLLGVALGVPVGIGLSELIKSLTTGFFPLPVYAQTFPIGLFVAAAALGLAIPPFAAALPVRRAVRVAPIAAIQTGHRAAKGGGAAAMRRIRLPGGSLAQLPVRNLARTMRRTLLTLLGLGGVIAAVVAVLGMVDAISDVADRQESELLRSEPDRLRVDLVAPEPASGPTIREIEGVPGVARAEPVLTVGSSVSAGEEAIDVALELVPSQEPIWRPTVTEGSATGGILLAGKAADDLGVEVGGTVLLRHPRLQGGDLVIDESEIQVAGIHANPVRALAYVDSREGARLGLAGAFNAVTVVPETGANAAAIERHLFGRPGVASARAVSTDIDALRTAIDEFNAAIQVVAVITLGLALLVAFTSMSVSIEERRREYATLFAFGVPLRSGIRVTVTESLITGIVGTAVGIAIGAVMLTWIIGSLIPETFPDLGAEVTFTPGSVALTLAVGIIAVTAAPLLTGRRLARMDIPSTLRVME